MSFSIRIDSPSLGISGRMVPLTGPVATIGRDAACTVVLSDPEKFVSRRHASLEMRGNAWQLTVTSSANTASVNGMTLACGQSSPLAPGDQVSIPPFELTLVANDVAAPTAGLPGPGAAPMEVDPFASDIFPSAPAPAAPAPDPFQMRITGARASGGGGLLDGLDFPSAPPAAADIPVAPQAVLDPLAILDRASAAAPPRGSRIPTAGRAAPDPAPAPAAASSWSGGGSIDDMPNPLEGLFDEPAPPPAPLAAAAPEHVHAFNEPFVLPPDPAPAPPPPAAAPQARAEPPRPAPAAAPGAALRALFEGLGLPPVAVSAQQEEQILRITGEIARAAIEGIMAVLLSRNQMKKELRVADRTMLVQKNNNPLKVMTDTEEALRFLFDPTYRPSSGFLPPPKAVRDACDDIFSHEVALMAAARAAVQGAIQRFDPAGLEERLDADKGGLLSNKRARLWDGYVEHYQKIERDMADEIDQIFEKDFLRAYMDQVKRLKR